MAQTYNIISLAAFSMAGVFLILAIFLWFRYGIRKIIGDLSGHTARKSIADMRSSKEKQGKRLYSPMGEGTSGSIKLKSVGSEKTASLENKEKLPDAEKTGEDDIQAAETELLEGVTDDLGSGATELLSENQYIYENDRDAEEMQETGLFEETGLLAENETAGNETTLLGSDSDSEFVVIQSIIYIHTRETI